MSINKTELGYSVSANILGNKISYQAITIADAFYHLFAVTALIRSRSAWSA